MPETRYTELYDNKGKIIGKEPYEVSDEQLAAEADQALVESYLAISPTAIKPKELLLILHRFAKRFGYKTP